LRADRLRSLLAEVAAGTLSAAEAESRLAWSPVEDLGFARVDHHRSLRHGYPEVVFGEGKTVEHILGILGSLDARGEGFLVTRTSSEAAEAIRDRFPDADWNPLARTVHLPAAEPPALPSRGTVLVVCAGTSDLPVAEEAAVTAAALGNPVERLNDVGVAGIHRILQSSEVLQRAAIVIVVAGMEGALPSVIGGLIRVPVIAVPTSVGYGAAFGGVAALLGMLNSCAAGVTVVNIDNGFGAACAASRINLARAIEPDREPSP
jgi:NCAIR mutase (PurE)-related protein